MGILRRQSAKSSVAIYVGIAIGYVNLIWLFPNIFTKEQVGLTRTLISVGAILSQFAGIGTPMAMVRFFTYFKNRKEGHYGFPTLLLGIVSAGLAAAILLYVVLRDPVTHLYQKNSPLFNGYYWWALAIGILMVLADFAFSYCRALIKLPIPTFFREVALRVAQTAAALCYCLGWVSFPLFIVLFAGSYLVQLLLFIGYLFYLDEFVFFTPVHLQNIVSRRQIIRFSLFMFAAASVAIYTANIDVLMLGIMAGLSGVGIYSVAFFIGTAIQVPARSMNLIASTLVASAWKENDHAQIEKLYRQTALTQLIIGGYLLLMVWVNVDLMLSLIPADYAAAKYVVLIVGAGKLLDMATGINGEIINVSKHVKVNLLTNILLILVTTAACYLLIPVYGVNGAALAVALSLLIYNAIRMAFLYYTYHLQPFSMATLKAIALLSVCFAIFYLLPQAGNIWITSIYRSLLLTLLFAVPMLYFRISEDINDAFELAVEWLRKRF